MLAVHGRYMSRGEQVAAMARAGMIGALALLAAGCGSTGKGESSSDGRLNGEWRITLRLAPPFGRGPAGDTEVASGTLAFIPNSAVIHVPGFGGVPQQIGTHNVRLDRIVPELSPRTTEALAAGLSTGDSVRLVLDPGSGDLIILRGRWQDSSVTGEWMFHRRAGIDEAGTFTLRRRRP